MSDFDADLYRAPITLWVEDPLQRSFLTALWQDADIQIRAAGGSEGVRYLVRGARTVIGKHVSGLVDRDFSLTNKGVWHDAKKAPCLRTEGHEFENHLLDFDVLSRASGVPAVEIEAIANGRATALTGWMACKETLQDLHAATMEGFPEDPAQAGGFDEDAAVDHIVSSKFWKQRSGTVGTWSKAEVRRCIKHHEQRYRESLTSDWALVFSGKEIFRHVRSRVPTLESTNSAKGSSADRDEDLAKRIAKIARKLPSSRVATTFAELRAALRARAGLPP